MDKEKLENQLEFNSHMVGLDDLKTLVPEDSISTINNLYSILESVRETGYAILISSLYEPQSEALEILNRFIPRNDRNLVLSKEFYNLLKRGYEKRVRNNIKHNPLLLQAEIESGKEPNITAKGKIGPGPYPIVNYSRKGGR